MRTPLSPLAAAALLTLLVTGCKDTPKSDGTESDANDSLISIPPPVVQSPSTSDTISIDSLIARKDVSDNVRPDDPYPQPKQPEEPAEGKKSGSTGGSSMVYASSDDGYANIRQEPSTKSPILGKLLKGGQGARLLDRVDGWYKIDFNGTIGYVYSPIVSIGKPSATKSETNSKGTAGKTASNTAKPAANNTGNVYYVVVASMSSLENAKKWYYNASDIFSHAPVYKVVSGDKTSYRICSSCHKSKEKASEKARAIRDLGFNVWVWESPGLGQCVYLPVGTSGNKVSPLKPQ